MTVTDTTAAGRLAVLIVHVHSRRRRRRRRRHTKRPSFLVGDISSCRSLWWSRRLETHEQMDGQPAGAGATCLVEKDSEPAVMLRRLLLLQSL